MAAWIVMKVDKLIKSELEYFAPILYSQRKTSKTMLEAWRRETLAQRCERISLETFDLCEGKVLRGLFSGLKLNRDTCWGKSDLGAQCLGFYEKEILDVIAVQDPFDTFLNLGSADGFYAVGMLHAKMAKKAICFELSEEGRSQVKENWLINESPGELEVHGEATEQSIYSVVNRLSENTLVLIDIEGGEFGLLSQDLIALIGKYKVIIEIHNWIDGFEEKYAALLTDLDRFFDIAIIPPSERNSVNDEILRSYPDENRLLVSSERRPCLMRFLYLVPKKQISE